MKVSINVFAFVAALWSLSSLADSQTVSIRFKAVVGSEDFACGRSYSGIGVTRSTINPRDFRFYVHNVRLVDEAGKEVPVNLDQDGKWQYQDVALLDFESGSGGCANGTPDMNMEVSGTVPAGHAYHGLRFTLGVPFAKNHSDLTSVPPPLNMTALAWSWNGGRKFLKVDFASTGRPKGYFFMLGSTGCRPNTTKDTVPTTCAELNLAEISLPAFDPRSDLVLADLAALLKDSNVDVTQDKYPSGCMSTPENADCAPLFANLGLPFSEQAARSQTFFRADRSRSIALSR